MANEEIAETTMELIPQSHEERVRAYWGEERLSYIYEVACIGTWHNDRRLERLPPLWLRIAHDSRHGLPHRQRVTIENHLLSIADDRGLRKSMPIVSPELADKIVNLHLVGDNIDNLDEGINPFNLLVSNCDLSCKYPNTSDIELAQSRIREYDETGQCAKYNFGVLDLRVIDDWNHTTRILEAQLIVLEALLGKYHRVVQEYEKFLYKYIANQVRYNDCMTNAYLPPPYRYRHAIILRFVHVVLFGWLRPIFYPNCEVVDVHDVDFEMFLLSIEGDTDYWMTFSRIPHPYQGWHFTNVLDCKKAT